MNMKHFKAPDGSPHSIDENFVHLLPEGCVEITEAEAIALGDARRPKVDPKVEALAYLQSTDWMVSRFVETGVAIPEEVSKKRAEARAVASTN